MRFFVKAVFTLFLIFFELLTHKNDSIPVLIFRYQVSIGKKVSDTKILGIETKVSILTCIYLYRYVPRYNEATSEEYIEKVISKNVKK